MPTATMVPGVRYPLRLIASRLAGVLLLATVVSPELPARAADELEVYQQRLAQLFRQLDRNGDGKNDWEDVKLARKAAAAKAQKKPVEEGMNFDDNRDGDLKQTAADMFSHAKKAAAKKVK